MARTTVETLPITCIGRSEPTPGNHEIRTDYYPPCPHLVKLADFMIGGRVASTSLSRRGHAMAKSTRANDESPELPLFRGVDQVLDLLGKLYRRPRLGEHSKPSEHREASRGLPMLCLVRPGEHETLLPAIAELLRKAEPHRVSHVFVDSPPPSDEPASPSSPAASEEPALFDSPALAGDPASDDPEEDEAVATPEVDDVPITGPDVHKVRELLVTIAGQLNDTWNALAGRLHFPRLSLALWLMEQDLSEVDMPQREAELRKRIWRREPTQRVSEVIRTNGQNAPEVTTWSALGAISILPWLVWRIRLSSPIPGLGRKYRWFRRQRYLAPEIPGTFIGFAERLTRKEWTQEEPEQVAKFLTNAFLEDLRVAYGRWPWRLRGARRMTYAVALLNNVTRGNGGYALLKLINDVRNETGFFDPLLVVTASRKVPPHAVEPTVNDLRDEVYDADEAEQGYSAWRQKLARDRRKRNDMTWYLPISTYTEAPDDRERSAIRKQLAAAPPYTVDSPPWWSRRVVPTVLVVCALTVATGGYVHYDRNHCGAALSQMWMFGSELGLETKNPGSKEAECVGVTDGSHLDAIIPESAWQPPLQRLGALFASQGDQEPDWPARIKALGDTIAQQNRDAEKKSHGGDRELATVAYLGDLSTRTPAAQHETLAGIAIAQRTQNAGESAPLLRVLVANGGNGMKYGQHVADTYLRELSLDDPSFVGVVGLNHSNDNTIDTIGTLTEVGLPIVASTLSLDKLHDQSPMYYQVSPRNRDQVEVALRFAEQTHHDQKVWIYRGRKDDNDNLDPYSENLDDDVRSVFGKDRVVSLKHDPFAAGEQACSAGSDDFVYYAGRGSDFIDFKRGIAEGCGNSSGSRTEVPTILASDDVTQHVAARSELKKQVGIPYYYQSFAAAPTTPNPRDSELEENEMTFYCNLNIFLHEVEENQLPNEHPTCAKRPGIDAGHAGLSLDGHAALAHDATEVMLKAIEGLHGNTAPTAQGEPVANSIPITPGAVWQQLDTLHDGTKANHTSLVTGNISFSDPETGNQVPKDKPIWIMRVQNGTPELTPFGSNHEN